MQERILDCGVLNESADTQLRSYLSIKSVTKVSDLLAMAKLHKQKMNVPVYSEDGNFLIHPYKNGYIYDSSQFLKTRTNKKVSEWGADVNALEQFIEENGDMSIEEFKKLGKSAFNFWFGWSQSNELFNPFHFSKINKKTFSSADIDVNADKVAIDTVISVFLSNNVKRIWNGSNRNNTSADYALSQIIGGMNKSIGWIEKNTYFWVVDDNPQHEDYGHYVMTCAHVSVILKDKVKKMKTFTEHVEDMKELTPLKEEITEMFFTGEPNEENLNEAFVRDSYKFVPVIKTLGDFIRVAKKVLQEHNSYVYTPDGKYNVSNYRNDYIIRDTTRSGLTWGSSYELTVAKSTADAFLAENGADTSIDEFFRKTVKLSANRVNFYFTQHNSNEDFMFNPVSAKKNTEPFGKASKAESKLNMREMLGLAFHGQIVGMKAINNETDIKMGMDVKSIPKPSKALIYALIYQAHFIGEYSSNKPIVVDVGMDVMTLKYSVSDVCYLIVTSVKDKKARLNKKTETAAPDSIMAKNGWKIGGWLTGSIHYSYLAGAYFYKIVGFSGKSTVIAQKYTTINTSNDSYTRKLEVGKTPEGSLIKIRVGSTGYAKTDEISHLSYSDTPRGFSGSAYD